MILGYFTPYVLDGAQGNELRVYPSLQKRWGWLVTWRIRVIELALIYAGLKAVLITLAADHPTNRGAVVLSSRFDRATA